MLCISQFHKCPSPPTPGNREAFAHAISPGGGTFAILSWPGGWAFAYPDPRAFDTHVFESAMDEFSVLKLSSQFCGRRGGLIVSVLVPGASGPGSSPGWGHCVVFLGKTLNSHSASLHPGVMGTCKYAGENKQFAGE